MRIDPHDVAAPAVAAGAIVATASAQGGFFPASWSWVALALALADTANLNTRLLSPSGRGRADYWRVAWKDA
ncbi:MAG: hypothetical protein QOF50_1358, partial [Gaiellaceae bacterium]|nr:hypothetical protein [Gaiellaceae bacterium]